MKKELDRYDFITYESIKKTKVVRCLSGKKISTFDLLRVLRNCLKQGLILDSRWDSTPALDLAVIKFSEESNLPIFVPDEKDAMILKASYSKKSIFDLKNIPDQYVSGIFYRIPINKIPKKMNPYLIIL